MDFLVAEVGIEDAVVVGWPEGDELAAKTVGVRK
ncbi:hypothetical protein HNQ71_006726 [Mesorhizobium sangaii]|uniref:Uncharacterized protein n=1 Tax=Mesorhizobium sangaii TaxID=505389 RepID=A0A841PFP9_9HYPH|nr:hypothetical protein [Mesorhizobium sangaii]